MQEVLELIDGWTPVFLDADPDWFSAAKFGLRFRQEMPDGCSGAANQEI